MSDFITFLTKCRFQDFLNLTIGPIILTLIFLISGFQTAHGCECFNRADRTDFRKAKDVFVGRVIKIENNETDNDYLQRNYPFSITFSVERKFKGRSVAEITVISRNEANCGGFVFSEGQRFLVYSFGANRIAFSNCTHSGSLQTPSECTLNSLKKVNSFWYRLFARIFPF